MEPSDAGLRIAGLREESSEQAEAGVQLEDLREESCLRPATSRAEAFLPR